MCQFISMSLEDRLLKRDHILEHAGESFKGLWKNQMGHVVRSEGVEMLDVQL